MEKEVKLEPRLFSRRDDSGQDDSAGDESEPHLSDELVRTLQREQARELWNYNVRRPIETPMPLNKSRFSSDDDLMVRNRRPLRKFEALSIGGKTLTEMSVGGFEVDLDEAANEARKVIPLPASKLPIIFVDEELNFYHHFFQSLSQLIGVAELDVIVNTGSFNATDDDTVLSLIVDIIKWGYEKGDSELLLFLKKVFLTTFKFEEGVSRKDVVTSVIVSANLWGFQYIEQTMKCEEPDLKMWLSMCYSHYRTTWFNTFKSTGVPEFARFGVKSRASSASSKSSMAALLEEKAWTESEHPVEKAGKTRRTHARSSKKSSKSGTNVGSWLAGGRKM